MGSKHTSMHLLGCAWTFLVIGSCILFLYTLLAPYIFTVNFMLVNAAYSALQCSKLHSWKMTGDSGDVNRTGKSANEDKVHN